MLSSVRGKTTRSSAQKSSRVRGITIAEVLIAATLLSFVVLGSLAAISRAHNLTNHARMITLSSQILQSAVEDLRLKNFTVIRSSAAAAQPINLTSTIASESMNNEFTRTMTLSANYSTLYASATTQFGLIRVVLTVSWTEAQGSFSRSAITYFGEKGLTDYNYVGF